MGYLLTKRADAVPDKTPLGVPYMKPADSETAGNMLAGLVTGGGLAGAGAIGNSLFNKKFMNDAAYAENVLNSVEKMGDRLAKSKNSAAQWLFKKLSMSDSKPAALLGKGTLLAHGFKNLQLPGKLKALGLLAAPFAAGGLIDAAIN